MFNQKRNSFYRWFFRYYSRKLSASTRSACSLTKPRSSARTSHSSKQAQHRQAPQATIPTEEGGRARGAAAGAMAGAAKGKSKSNEYGNVSDEVAEEYTRNQMQDAAKAGAAVGASKQRQQRRQDQDNNRPHRPIAIQPSLFCLYGSQGICSVVRFKQNSYQHLRGKMYVK